MMNWSRRGGLVAVAFAIVLLASMAAFSAVQPNTGFFALTVRGSIAGDTTAVSGVTNAPAIVYLDATNTTGYGVVADSRPADAAIVASELAWTGSLVGGSSDNYYTARSVNLRSGLPGGYRTFTGIFSSGTTGAGSLTYGYSATHGGITAFTDSLSLTSPTIVQNSAAILLDTPVNSIRNRDTVISFAGLTTTETLARRIPAVNALSCSYSIRYYVFTDSTGYITHGDTPLIGYPTLATDSDLLIAVPFETRTWTRVYVEGRRNSDSAPIFMGRFATFAAETATALRNANQAVVSQGLIAAIGTDTITVGTGTFTESYVLARSRFVNANIPHFLRADSNSGLSAIGESNAQVGPARIANTTMTIAMVDTSGNLLTPATTCTYVLDLNQLTLNVRDTSQVQLARYNPATMTWDGVSSSTTSAGIMTAHIGQQGIFALVVSPVVAAAASSGGSACVLDATVGRTGLAGILPALRSARDMVLGSSFGRLFVSGYYGFAAIFMIAAVGFGATFASDRK